MKKKRKGKILLDRNRKGEWYIKLVASNGRILCHTEGYKRWQSAHNAYTAIRNVILEGDMEMTEKAMRPRCVS